MTPEGLPADAPAPPPDRSRRVYAWWIAALTVLAALGAACWLVVGPVLEARSAAEDLSRSMPHQIVSNRERAATLIARLGGPEKAARKLRFFLRTPGWAGSADENLQWAAVILLAYSGDPALPTLGALLDSPVPDTQAMAALGMAVYCLNRWPADRNSPVQSLPMPWSATEDELRLLLPGEISEPLARGAKDTDPQVRANSAKALDVWAPSMEYRPY